MAAASESPDHLQWIVDGRSANQQCTMDLYRLIHENKAHLNGNIEHYQAAMDLTAVAFSLWRAVFLSDTTGGFKDQTADVHKFLVSLIADNTVLYLTDKNSRNWSFRYYLDNARFRLERMSSSGLIDVDKLNSPTEDDKQEWWQVENILEEARRRLTERVEA